MTLTLTLTLTHNPNPSSNSDQLLGGLVTNESLYLRLAEA